MIKKSKIPASFNKMIFSHNGTPIDFVHLAVNNAYEELTDQTQTGLVGKKFTDVFMERPEDHTSLISLIASVALTGTPAEIEKYFKSFQKWIHISISSSEKDYFTLLFEDITEKKHLELKFKENNQTKPSLSDSESGLWILDDKELTKFVNSKIACMLGYSADKILGRSFLEFVDEHNREIVKDAWREQSPNRQFEIALIREDGTPINTLVQNSILTYENGKASGKILKILDISEHKRVEKALPTNKKKYRSLFQTKVEGFACCQALSDQLGNMIGFVFVDANEAFKRLTGVQNKTVLGQRILEVFPEVMEDSFDWIEIFNKIVTYGNVVFERYVPGIKKWLSIRVHRFKENYFAIILTDITSNKSTEQDLRRSEKRYKQLANSITDLFFAVDSELKFTYWNKASEIFTGLAAEKVIGHHFFDVFGNDDEVTRKITKIYLKAMKIKKPHTYTGRLPKFNSNCIFEVYVYPTGNGIAVLAKDVTERKKLQETLEQYTRHLEDLVKIRTEKLRGTERLAAIGETAGMIGHDIRNPLQSIIGELYLAKSELSALDDGEIKKNLSESILFIEEQTIYINKIVSDLQDYAKELTPITEETNLEKIIHGVISKLDIPNNIKVAYSLDKPFPILLTDPLFLTRILTNLTLNGLQAMQDFGGELTIEAFVRDKKVIITVADTGKGIPDEIKSKIFKPLFTTKPKGQGFGLAVVKKLVEGLKGSVSYETDMGKGTKFIVEIPNLKK